MKIAILAFAIALGGCQSVLTGADNALARAAGGPGQKAACDVVRVAEGYFANVKDKVTPAAQTAAAQAGVVVNTLCNNPPKDLVSLITELNQAWVVIQAATTVPK